MPVTQSASRPMTPREWAMLLGLSVLWGGSFFFNAVAVAELPVFTVVAGRVVLAALILRAVLGLRHERLPGSLRPWLALFAMGLLNNVVPFSLIVAGQQHLASGVASILNASTPLFTVLFAHVFTRDERLTTGKAVGVLVGFAGVAVMIGTDALWSGGGQMLAEAMCLAAAMSYGFAGIFGRRFRRMGISPMATATGQLIASSTMLVPLALVLDRPWTLAVPSAGAIGALLGVAVFSTALAYVLFFRILATAGATNLALVTLLIPISATLLGVAFLDEHLLRHEVLGMAIIGLGLVVIDGRLFAVRQG